MALSNAARNVIAGIRSRKRDVSNEPRDYHGRWTKGGGGRAKLPDDAPRIPIEKDFEDLYQRMTLEGKSKQAILAAAKAAGIENAEQKYRLLRKQFPRRPNVGKGAEKPPEAPKAPAPTPKAPTAEPPKSASTKDGATDDEYGHNVADRAYDSTEPDPQSRFYRLWQQWKTTKDSRYAPPSPYGRVNMAEMIAESVRQHFLGIDYRRNDVPITEEYRNAVREMLSQAQKFKITWKDKKLKYRTRLVRLRKPI